MKYKLYPAYKESGVEWLGEVPAHWEVKQVRHVLQTGQSGLKIGPFGSMLKLEDTTDEGIRVYGQENVISNDFTRGKRFITENKFKELSIYETFPGDILITMMGTSGRCVVVPEDAEQGIIDSHLVRLSLCKDSINSYFFERLIDESAYVKGQVDFLGKGSIMQGLNSSIIKSLVLAVPSLTDQLKINFFLDRETAKIDILIAKQEHLIELLGEKRTALISHAVTKGLNPDAPMKESGVEWLGEVPEHWNATQLRRYILFITSGSRGWAENYSESGSIFIRIGNLTRHSIDIDLTDIQYVQPPAGSDGERTIIKEGDILFSITAYLGSVAIAGKEIQGAYVSQHVALVRLDTDFIYSRFVAYAMLSDGGKNQLQGNAYGGAKVQLGLEDVKETWIPVPPLEEQRAIVAFVDYQTAKIDTLITKARRAIDLLKERRTALISAAVTGKIDVREAFPSVTPE